MVRCRSCGRTYAPGDLKKEADALEELLQCVPADRV